MKIGTIGNGVIVRDFLTAVRSLAEEEDVSCVAMLALREADIPATKELADEFGIGKVYSDREEFFRDPQIDFVYIALPNAFHYEYSLLALKNGKNVFCEKPFVPTLKQAEALAEAAKENRKMIFEMITTIYFPNYLSLKERMKEIGKVTIAECNFSHVSGKYYDLLAGKNPNVFSLDMCAGAFADMGIYAAHFLMGIFGKPQEAVYYANKYETGIDTAGMLALKWKDCCGIAISSKHSRGRNALILQGEDGYISCDCGGNFITGYTINKGKESEYVNVQPDKPRLYFELKEFKKIFDEQDFERCYEILDYTQMVVSVCESASKNAGIIYPIDKDGTHVS